MPYTLNGFGTGYWGKRNLHRVAGVCDSCGKHTVLSSYDTRLCFVVVFLPVVPLARKRILNQCQACTQHATVSLKQWSEERERETGKALEAVKTRPDDPDVAAHLLRTLIGYQDAEGFSEAAPMIDSRHKRDAQVLKVLGVGYEYFGNVEAAERTYRQALAAKNESDTRGLLATRLMRRGAIDEARPLIEKNLGSDGEEAAGDAFMLAQCFQAEGRHEDALRIVETLKSVAPSAASDKEVAKLEKASRKRVGTQKPIAHAHLKGSGAGSTSKGSQQNWKLALVAGLAVLTVGSWLYATFDAGQNRRVHLVNGLGVGYTVSVNGEPQHLRPNSRTMIHVSEGQVTVDATQSGLPLDRETVTVATPFLSRVFRDHLFLINPDRAALVVWEEAVYSENAEADDAAEPQIHTGELFYEFTGVDYPFGEFPDEITIEGKKSYRQRVDLLNDVHPMMAAAFLGGPEGSLASDWLLRRTRLEPDDLEVLTAAVNLLEPATAMELLEPGLAERPVRVEWHRMYQSLMETARPDVDLAAEYDALLSEDGNDPLLLYLRGRVATDPSRAASFFRRALEQEGDVSYAANGLAYQELATGAFRDALTHVNQALEIHPKHPSFHMVHDGTLLAAGRYEERLAEVQKALDASPLRVDLASEGIFLLTRLGREPEIDPLIGQVVEAYRNEYGDEAAAAKKFLVAQRRYISGDLEGHAKALTDHPWLESDWQVLVNRGKVQAAHELLVEQELETSDARLVLALAACLGPDTELAARLVEEAVDALGTGSSAQRLLAAHLAGEATDTRELLELAHDVPEKRLALAVLVARGQSDERVRSLAAKLNYDGRFPHHLVQQAVER